MNHTDLHLYPYIGEISSLTERIFRVLWKIGRITTRWKFTTYGNKNLIPFKLLVMPKTVYIPDYHPFGTLIMPTPNLNLWREFAHSRSRHHHLGI
jgi:hypothetical protein